MVERRLEPACVRVRLELLGGFRARDEAGQELAIGSRKAQALLAFLALSPGKPQPREKLTSLLWSDRGEAQARSSLRQALSTLRRALPESDPPILRAQRDSVWLDPEAVEVDAVTLERLVGSGEPEDLAQAAELYQGDFLDGLDVRDAAFEEWLRGERERLREQTSQALVRLLDQQVGDMAIATARRLLALDPLNEATHRRLVRLYADAGDRIMALRQYASCREVLQAELGVEPDDETRQLVEEVGSSRIGDRESKKDAPPTNCLQASSQPPSIPDKPSIAVLPFTNMSGDPEQEHFSDGITEDIITALSKLSKLFVVARNSTFTYKGRAIDIRQVGQEQGVRYVLEGSVQRGSKRLRIAAQLIDAQTGHHIWAQRYDRAMQDFFELQDEITREITSALQVELTEGEQARLWASGTQNLEAWECAIQVPELLHSHRRADVLPARRLAERALQLDENYASAWAMLGWSYWNEAFNGWTENPDAVLKLAVDAMERARAIDDSNPDTLALLAFLHLSLRKYDKARSLIENAMALGPNNSFAPAVAANVELFCNKPHEMVPLLKRAMRLCPIFPAWYLGDLAYAYLLMDRQQEAISTAKEAIKIDPDYIYNYHILAIAYAELGEPEQARAAAENILRIEPKSSISTYKQSQPFKDDDLRNRTVEGLRMAGLPE